MVTHKRQTLEKQPFVEMKLIFAAAYERIADVFIMAELFVDCRRTFNRMPD